MKKIEDFLFNPGQNLRSLPRVVKLLIILFVLIIFVYLVGINTIAEILQALLFLVVIFASLSLSPFTDTSHYIFYFYLIPWIVFASSLLIQFWKERKSLSHKPEDFIVKPLMASYMVALATMLTQQTFFCTGSCQTADGPLGSGGGLILFLFLVQVVLMTMFSFAIAMLLHFVFKLKSC